jgi:ribosomal protein L12E/L44/L45/RPP1/RPP2
MNMERLMKYGHVAPTVGEARMRKTARMVDGVRMAAVALGMAALVGAAGCTASTGSAPAAAEAAAADRTDQSDEVEAETLDPLVGLRTSIRDEVTELDGGRIRWQTLWELCWDAHARAGEYELQTVTSEGTSPAVKAQREPCVSMQIAKGENAASAGLANRDITVATMAGQVGYRVRAVAVDGGSGPKAVSAWSAPYLVSEVPVTGGG